MRSTSRTDRATRSSGAKHHLQGPGDMLTWLADEIPIPAPVHIVASAGDLVSLVGAGWLMARATMGEDARSGGGAEPVGGVDPVRRGSIADRSAEGRRPERATASDLAEGR